jgi:hypothetical protein
MPFCPAEHRIVEHDISVRTDAVKTFVDGRQPRNWLNGNRVPCPGRCPLVIADKFLHITA